MARQSRQRSRPRNPSRDNKTSPAHSQPDLPAFINQDHPKLGKIRQEPEPQRTQHILQEVLHQTVRHYHLTSACYVTLNSTGKIVTANLSFSAIVKMNLNLLPHCSFSRFLIQADHQKFSYYLSNCIHNGTTLPCQFNLLRADGTVFPGHLQMISHNDCTHQPDQYDFLLIVPTQQAEPLESAATSYTTLPDNLLRTISRFRERLDAVKANYS